MFKDASGHPVHLESWFKMKDAPISDPIDSKRVADEYEKINKHFNNIEKGAYTPINQNKELSSLLHNLPTKDRNLIEGLRY